MSDSVTQFGPSMSVSVDLIVQIGFLCILAGYIIYTVILHYHWKQFSMNKSVTRTTLLGFLITTLPLFAIMGLMALGTIAN